MKKLLNLSKRVYMHSLMNKDGTSKVFRLEPGKTQDIPDEIAQLWLRSSEVQVVADDEKDKEIERLKKELAKAQSNKDDEKSEKEELLKKAASLGLNLKGLANAKIETLKKKIAEAEEAAQNTAV